MEAIAGTPIRMKTMANGNARLEIEFEEKDLVAVAIMSNPTLTLAVVPITAGAAKEAQINDAVKGGPLSKNAAMLCQDENFQYWATHLASGSDSYVEFSEAGSIFYIKAICDIKSRSELDHNPEAAAKYEQLKREFLEWKQS